MARQNIQFKGIRHTPSDITGQDGDLLECVNLVHDGGELKPIQMPEKVMVNGEYTDSASGIKYQGIIAAVHNLTSGDKFVFIAFYLGSSMVIVKDGSNAVVYTHNIAGENVQWVETIGNTLVIGTDKSTHYALFKNGSYKWLGDKLPQPLFLFDFQRDSTTHDGALPGDGNNGYYVNEYDPNTYCLTKSGDAVDGGGIPIEVVAEKDESSTPPGECNLVVDSCATLLGDETTEWITLANVTAENKKIFRDSIKSRHASVMKVLSMNNNFAYPFLVRYAVRIYDNNYVMHSAPKLMIPSSLVEPILAYIKLNTIINGAAISVHVDSENKTYVNSFDVMKFRGMGLVYKFAGWVDEDGSPMNADDWDDIIKGVDLFMSSQIYSYDESRWSDINKVPTTFKVFHNDNNNKDFGYCYTQNNKISWWDVFTSASDINPIEGFQTFLGNELETFWDSSGVHPYNAPNNKYWYTNYKIPLPQKSNAEMMDEIENTHLFYRVKEYDLSELSNWGDNYKRFSQEASRGIIERLETLPTLPDDYASRSRISAKVSYNYNQRLVLGNLRLQAPMWYHDERRFSNNNLEYAELKFIIEKQEKSICIAQQYFSEGGGVGDNDFGHYIFYPDPDCKKVIATILDGSDLRYIEIPMKEHTGLHGAYALMPDIKSLKESKTEFKAIALSDIPSASTDDERYYALQNTIAMSLVANPFHFPASNFKDCGRERIIGIAANVLDVSYEQWGPFPLYAFCADGIVAITINKDGTFGGGVEAVSADVLLEPKGLSRPTLIQANQMLVFITQQGVLCLGNGTKPKPLSLAMEGRHFNSMAELADVNYHYAAFAQLVSKTSDSTAFRDYAAEGFLAYDYAHNRVVLSHPRKNYQYILSLDTMLWSKQLIYINGSSAQIPYSERAIPMFVLDSYPVVAAMNNYTEMYLQGSDYHLYKTMEVTGENSTKQLYQYGYLVSRPIRFGTDEYKSIIRLLNRYTHYAKNSFAKIAVYGSRDGVKYGRINTLRGMSYQYFIFVIYTYLKPNERYSYMTVDFEPRLTNKLR